MKRLWAAALLLLCAATLCVWQGSHTQQTAQSLSRELNAALSASEEGDSARAASHAQDALREWQDARELLCIYTAHTRVEELGRTLSGMAPLARRGTLDQFDSECEKALAQVEALRGLDAPTLDNIL